MAHAPFPVSDPIDTEALARAAHLGTIEHHAEVGSTMDRARELAVDPQVAVPAVVIADRQMAGRGRRGAGWWQAPGSLATSIVLDGRDQGGGEVVAWWSLVAGIALAETLTAIEPEIAALVRWPNDVEVSGRKLAGILVEVVGRSRAVFGIGVNTAGRALDAPPALRGRLVTVPDVRGHPLGRTSVLAAFLPRLCALLDLLAADPAALVERYQPWCSLTGHRVTLHLGGVGHEGLCSGIASDGSLVLDTPAGLRRFASGSLTAADDVWRGT